MEERIRILKKDLEGRIKDFVDSNYKDLSEEYYELYNMSSYPTKETLYKELADAMLNRVFINE